MFEGGTSKTGMEDQCLVSPLQLPPSIELIFSIISNPPELWYFQVSFLNRKLFLYNSLSLSKLQALNWASSKLLEKFEVANLGPLNFLPGVLIAILSFSNCFLIFSICNLWSFWECFFPGMSRSKKSEHFSLSLIPRSAVLLILSTVFGIKFTPRLRKQSFRCPVVMFLLLVTGHQCTCTASTSIPHEPVGKLRITITQNVHLKTRERGAVVFMTSTVDYFMEAFL